MPNLVSRQIWSLDATEYCIDVYLFFPDTYHELNNESSLSLTHR